MGNNYKLCGCICLCKDTNFKANHNRFLKDKNTAQLYMPMQRY